MYVLKALTLTYVPRRFPRRPFPPSAERAGVLRGGDVPVPPVLGGRAVHERGPEAAVREQRRGAWLLPHRDRRQASALFLFLVSLLTAPDVVGLEKGLFVASFHVSVGGVFCAMKRRAWMAGLAISRRVFQASCPQRGGGGCF